MKTWREEFRDFGLQIGEAFGSILLPSPAARNKRRLEELEIRAKELELEKTSEAKSEAKTDQMHLPLNGRGERLEPIAWNGTGPELGAWLLRAYWGGFITAGSPQLAVRQHLKYFLVQSKTGAPSQPNADSIESALRREGKFRDPRPFESRPICPKCSGMFGNVRKVV